MKGRTSRLAVALFVAILAAPAVEAAFSLVSVEADLTVPGGLDLTYCGTQPVSLSLAVVQDSLGNGASTSQSGTVNTSAYASIPTATQSAATSNLHVESKSSAVPPPISWSVALGSASQTWYFQVTDAGGNKTFTLSYSVLADLGTDWITEYATGQAVVTLTVARRDQVGWTAQTQTFSWNKVVEDGADYQYNTTGQLVISRYYAYGNLGTVTLSVQSAASAYTIPAPGALLLTALGTVLAGWLRLRRIA